MLIHEAFNETLRRYNISGLALAQTAEVSQSLVSQFRNGKKGVTDEMLDNLLCAMQKLAPGSRKYFCSMVAGEPVGTDARINNVIDTISEEDIPEILEAIARRWKGEHPRMLRVSNG